MSFVRPFLADRQQISNVAPSESSETEMQDQEEDSQVDDVTSPASILSAPSTSRADSSASNKSQISAEKRSHMKRKQNTLSSAQVLQDYLNEKASRRKCTPEIQLSSDPITKFFDCMAETVKAFPPQLQIEVKSKIFGIVSDAETKNMNLRSISPTYSQGEAAFARQTSETTRFYQQNLVTMPQPQFLQQQHQLSYPQSQTHHPSAIRHMLHSQSYPPFCQQRTTASTPLPPPSIDFPEDVANINDDNNDSIQCI